MLKKYSYILLLVISAASLVNAQNAADKCTTLSEPSLGLSFCVPQKWKIVKDKNDAYQKILGEVYNNLTPIMSVDVIIDKSPLPAFVAKKMDGLYRNYKNTANIASVEPARQTKFNAGKLRGYKAALGTSSQKGSKFWAIFYFFNGKDNQKIVLSALVPFGVKDELEKVLDDAVRTLKIKY